MNKKNNCIRIGTRRSALAKSQSNWVKDRLQDLRPDIQVELVEIVTTGDRILDSTLSKVPGKGVFVKEIEEKLLSEEIDLAVHSLKDLPTEIAPGLTIAAIPHRVDARDVLVTRLQKSFAELPRGARIGTSSLRRKAQLLKARPDLQIVDIRGNIDTRLRKSETNAYDAIVLAAAGLLRMGWQDRVFAFFDVQQMIPAVGQGALGLQIRQGDTELEKLMAPLNDETSAFCVRAERIFLSGMGGGCQTPMGAHCVPRDGKAVFFAFHAEEDGGKYRYFQEEASFSEAGALAEKAVQTFLRSH